MLLSFLFAHVIRFFEFVVRGGECYALACLYVVSFDHMNFLELLHLCFTLSHVRFIDSKSLLLP